MTEYEEKQDITSCVFVPAERYKALIRAEAEQDILEAGVRSFCADAEQTHRAFLLPGGGNG